MKNSLISGIRGLGKIIGRCVSLVYPRQIELLCFNFKKGFCTGVKKSWFKTFGRNSLIAPGVRVLNGKYISVGDGVSFLSGCVIETVPGNLPPDLIIGDGCSINEYTHITCAGKITIGENLLTGRFCLIADNSHGSSFADDMNLAPLARKVRCTGEIKIGKNVWLGDRVTILGGVSIGDGAVIGANSVVTKDIPAYSVAVGVPAKVVKNAKE